MTQRQANALIYAITLAFIVAGIEIMGDTHQVFGLMVIASGIAVLYFGVDPE